MNSSFNDINDITLSSYADAAEIADVNAALAALTLDERNEVEAWDLCCGSQDQTDDSLWELDDGTVVMWTGGGVFVDGAEIFWVVSPPVE